MIQNLAIESQFGDEQIALIVFSAHQGKRILILLERENKGCSDCITEINSNFLNKVVISSLYCEKMGVCVCPECSSVTAIL
jgi:hypothetical protein